MLQDLRQPKPMNGIMRNAFKYILIVIVLLVAPILLMSQNRIIVNPSFETGSGLNFSSNVQMKESQRSQNPTIDGWYTNHPPSGGLNSPIECWRGSNNPDRNTPAQSGNYFVELNAYQASRLYQIVFLVNGETINWRYFHRQRQGAGTQNIEFSIYSENGNTKLYTINTHTATNINVWDDVHGSYVFNGPTGVYQIGFESTTSGSSGNFLDNVTIGLNALSEFTRGASVLSETNSAYRPYFRVNGDVKTASTVNFSVTAVNATEGVDYQFPVKSITIQPGQYSSADSIPISFQLLNHTPVTGPKQITITATVTGSLDLRDANGDGFTGSQTISVYENLPGGVSVPNLWYKANTGVTTGAIFRWDNEGVLANANASQNIAANQPVLNTSGQGLINFNSSLSFDGASDFLSTANLNILPVANNATTGSQFIVFRRKGNSTGNIYTNAANTSSAWGVGATVNGGIWQSNMGRSVAVADNSVAMTSLVGTASANANLSMQLNGSGVGVTNFNGQFNHHDNDAFTIGKFSTGSFANMDLAEIIIYPTAVSSNDRSKVQSYLALKYGISLGNNTDAVGYVASNNTSIWNASSVYKYDIFGIGHDDLSGLNQNKSNNANTGGGDGTGVSGKGNIIISNPTSLDNYDFLVIGHDNGKLNETTTGLPASELTIPNAVLERKWKVKHTGNVGTVDLTLNLAGLCLSSRRAADYHLLIDTDGDGLFTTGSLTSVVASSLNNDLLQFNGVTLPDGVVFTIKITSVGVKPLAGTSNDQNICVGQSVPNMRFIMNNGSLGAIVSGLPQGMRYQIANELLVTISGTPTSAGTFTYKILPIGSGCAKIRDTVVGTIIVKDLPAKPVITAGGPTAFCAPGSVVLSGGASTGNQWLLNGNPITNATGLNYTATTSGNYTLINSQNGCSSIASDIMVVTANAVPEVPHLTPVHDERLCDGSRQQLISSSPDGKSQWFRNDVAIPGATGHFYHADRGGVYYVVGTDAGGCVSGKSNPITITEELRPTVAPIIGADSVCVGSSIQLTSSTLGGVWSVFDFNSFGLNVDIDGNGLMNVLEAGTTTVTYEVTGANGCLQSVTKDIVLVAPPSKPVITASGATAFCLPGSVTLSGGAATGNQWLLNGNPIANATGLNYTTSSSGTYSLRNTQNGCTSEISNAVNISANATPAAPVIKAEKLTTACEGGVVKLITAGQSGIQWVKDGVVIPGATSNFYEATQSGVYYADVVNASGCVSGLSNAINVTIFPIPQVNPIVGADVVCTGSTIQLSNTTPGGTWTISNNSVATINGSGLLTGVGRGNVTVTYTVVNASGCAESVSTIITVKPTAVKPVIITTGSTAFCAPGSVLLSGGDSTGNQWFLNSSPIANETGKTYTATTSGSYTLINTLNGCASPVSDFVEVTANPTPAVPVIKGSKTPVICAGDQVRLITGSQSGVQWFKDGLPISGATTNKYDATTSGAYHVVVTNNNGCVSGTSASIIVTVNPVPVVGAITGAGEVCTGSMLQLANATSGGVWNSSNSNIASINGNGLITAIAAGIVTVSYTVTNSSGCIITVTKDIIIKATPAKPVITHVTPTAFCAPGSVVLSGNDNTGNQWYLNGVAINNATAIDYTATVSGAYSLINTQNGCSSLQSDPVDVTANSTPSVPVIKAAKSSVVCEGNVVKLITSGQTGIQWFKDGVTITGATKNFYDASVSGAYYASVTNNSGCVSGNSNLIQVQVNPNPVIDPITGNNAVCTGSTIQLNNTTPGGVWNISNNGIATINGAGIVTGIAKGDVTVSYTITSSAGCETTVFNNITVKSTPAKPVISSFGPTAFCAPGSVVLSGGATTGNQWFLNTNPISNATSLEYTASASGSYTLINTSDGCTSPVSDNIEVIANPTPSIPLIKGSKAPVICAGDQVKLVTASQSGIQWFKDGVAINGATNSVYDATSSGVYYVAVTNTSGCVSGTSASVTVTVNPLPTVNAITGAGVVCAGSTIQLSNTSVGGVWDISNSSIATVSATGLITGIASGNVTVRYTVTNGSGCSTTVTKDIIVNATPLKPVITHTTPTAFCAPGSVVLTGNTATGNQWLLNGNPITNATAQNYTATASGIYTLINTQNGCSSVASDPVDVIANPTPLAPVIKAARSTIICEGDQVRLFTASQTGVQWYKDGAALNGETNNFYDATLAGSYTLIANNSSGCVSGTSNAIVVTVNSLPSVNVISGASSVCAGSTTTFTNTTNGGVWSTSNTNIAGIASNGLVSGFNAGKASISYTLTDGNGCVQQVSKTIKVNALPSTGVITGTHTICVGELTQLTSSVLGGIWSTGNAAIATIDAGGNVTAISAGNLTLSYTVTNGAGCTSTTAWNMTVIAKPAMPVITPQSSTAFCAPGSVVLSSDAALGNRWYQNGILITNAVNATYTATSTGTYTVESVVNGCTSLRSDQIEVTANPTPLAPVLKASKSTVLCQGESVKLHTSTQSGNEWYKDGVLIPGVTGSVYTVTQSGRYSLRTTNAASCVSGTSVEVNVTVNPLPVVADITGSATICTGNTTTLSNATSGGVWSSNNNSVATINSTGVVTALNTGSAKISYTVTGTGGCTVSKDFTMLVNQTPVKPVITASGPTSLCVLESVVLSSSSSVGNQWYNNGVLIPGETGIDFTTTESGVYTVVSTNNGCSSTSDAITVTKIPDAQNPVITAGATNVCYGQSVVLSASIDKKNRWYKDGILIPGATGKQFVATESGTYYVEAIPGTTCITGISNSITVTINDRINVPPITGYSTLCSGNTMQASNNSAGGVWQSSNTAIATVSSTGLVTAITAGRVTILYTVSNGQGCTETVSFPVTVFASPTPQPITGVSPVCVGNTITLGNTVSGGIWLSADSTIASVQLISGSLLGKKAGTTIIGYLSTNNTGCISLATTNVVVNGLPTVTATANPTTVSKGLNTTLTATGAGTVLWSPAQNITSPNAAVTTARVLAPTTYTARLTDLNGCVNTATVSVNIVEDLFVSPVIVMTPNGDGINDYFVIRNLDVYPSNKLRVYNRAGKLVYEATNYNNLWDGRVNGKILEKDTYMFVLTVNGVVVKKGSLDIIR